MTDMDQGTYEFRTEGEAKPATSFVVAAGGVAASLGAAQVALTKGDDMSLTTRVGNKFSLAVGDGSGVLHGGAEVTNDHSRLKLSWKIGVSEIRKNVHKK